MTGGPAAVEAGADGTRLVVPGPDGRAEPVAVLPPGTTPAAALDALVGPAGPGGPGGPVVLVHPPDRTAAVDLAGRAVRPVAAPIAICPSTGVWLVVDAGRGGVGLTVVDDGRVAATERLPAGGDHLDALVAAALGVDTATARTVREALSVREAVDLPGAGRVDAARVEDVLRAPLSAVAERAGRLAARYRAVEVVLAGGVARTPLLAELCDERAGRRPVRVLAEPDLAAVRGALDLVRDDGPATGAAPDDPARNRATPHPAGPDPAGPGPAADDPDRGAPEGRSRRRVTWSSVLVVLGLLLAGAGTALGRIPAAPVTPAGTVLAQYGYTVTLPAGWEHTGGEPSRRRVLLTRTGAPDGVGLVSVERSPLDYDAGVEPDRAAAETAAVYRGTGGLRDLRPDTVAGRAVTRYAQPSGPDAVVDWYLLFEGPDELAVGCRHPARSPAPELDRACAAVVGSVHVPR